MTRKLHLTLTNCISACAAFSLFTAGLLLTPSVQGQGCQVYPIALSAQTLTGLQVGAVLTDIWNGAQPGNFGWLSWAGDPGEPTLVDSLTAPGDSSTYVNPDSSTDHQLAVGKWVSSRPGVANGKHVRAALNSLLSIQIVVPVWDQVRGQGDNADYHIIGFAAVQILDYQLPSQNRITAQFLGFVDCGNWTTSVPVKHDYVFELASR
jgi:hypothetical protein